MRHLRPTLLLTAGALVLGACGGDTAPDVEAGVAEDLAQRADALAAGLAADDACGALETAADLVRVTGERRDAGEVPAAVAAEVIATTERTVEGLTCEPDPPSPAPAPPAEPDDDDDSDDEGEDDDPKGGERGKGGSEGKGEGKGRDG